MQSPVRLAHIEHMVSLSAAILGIDQALIRSPDRRYFPAYARRAIYLVLRDEGWTLQEIGEAFERDHSSVHDQLPRSKMLYRSDTEFRYLVNTLRSARGCCVSPLSEELVAEARTQVARLDEAIAEALRLRASLAASF